MKFTFYIIILAVIAGVITYGAINWQKYGNFTGKNEDADFDNLLQLANFYNGKNVCTSAYLLQSEDSTVLKANFDNDIHANSIWINNISGKSFFVDALGDGKGAKARVCGKFQYGQGFGQPSFWNRQIDVSNFEIKGTTVQLPR